MTRVTALEARTTALEARAPYLRRSTPKLPLIALGANYDQAITWSTPMPSATYKVEAIPGPGLVGNGTATVVAGTQTAAGVTVRITAAVLITAGATVDVTAYAVT